MMGIDRGIDKEIVIESYKCKKNIGVVAFLSRPCPNLAKAKYQVA